MVIKTLLAVFLATKVANALPGMAGSCNGGSTAGSGTPAVGAGHTSRNPTGNGGIADGGYSVTVGGNALTSSSSFMVGQDYTITLSGPTFLGHLLRLGNTGSVDASSGMTVTGTQMTDSQILGSGCPSTVVGVTHTGNIAKTSVSATFNCPSASDTYIMDVNVVVANCAPDSSLSSPCDPANSTWYHSFYTFACTEAGGGGGDGGDTSDTPCYSEAAQVEVVQDNNNNQEDDIKTSSSSSTMTTMPDVMPGDQVKAQELETVYGFGHAKKVWKKQGASYRQLFVEPTNNMDKNELLQMEEKQGFMQYPLVAGLVALLSLAVLYRGGAEVHTK